MPDNTLPMLLSLAAFIAVVHTVTGPDHYVPFVAMSRAGRWSLRRTMGVTVLCGVGHVLGSVLIGVVGMGAGYAVERLQWFEGVRGGLADWLMLGFGLAYLAWGLRRAAVNRPHTHVHAHADGTVHVHEHRHREEHVHVHLHATERDAGPRPSLTPWVLFTIFIFGPCEPLIPILMVPAMQRSAWSAALVVSTFAVCTIATMALAVLAGYYGLRGVSFARWERYSHALAGLALAVCGGAMAFLGM